jgi:uncharacterized membrane protein
MPFCGNCGAEVTGGFCAKCGTPLGGQAAPGPVPGGGGQFAPGPGPGAGAQTAAGLQENVAGALCYLVGLITGIIFLVLAPYNQNPRIRFHAFQSIFFNVAWIILHYAFSIVIGAMGYELLGAMFAILTSLVFLVIGLGGFLLWLVLMYKAYNNTPLVLPIIGPIAQKQAGAAI